MRYRFGSFELDTDQFTLKEQGREIHVEPLVFDLLRLLVENEGQLLTRDAVVARVWDARFVTDATIASGIKSARKALGDSGELQTYIRTVRGRGFQFSAAVESDLGQFAGSALSYKSPRPEPARPGEHVSPPRIAVLPLFPLLPDPDLAVLGDALAQEVILELSRLHWLFVIARGSSFKFRGQEIDLADAATTLGVDYVLTGTILRLDSKVTVGVELCHVPDNAVIWAERFRLTMDDLLGVRSTLAAEIAAALETRIELAEAFEAGKLPTEHLDAWAAYHRGLSHMYRFNDHDNGRAAHFFSLAANIDPGFARAQAGLSFTHFQNAFLGFSTDGECERRLAKEHALRALDLDPLDPFVNLTMGRSEWLAGNLDACLPWMERSISLRPTTPSRFTTVRWSAPLWEMG